MGVIQGVQSEGSVLFYVANEIEMSVLGGIETSTSPGCLAANRFATLM